MNKSLFGTLPQALLSLMVLLVAGMMFVSCSHEDANDIVDPEANQDASSGTVTYSFDSNGGKGTSDSPAVAQMGETLDMTIKQTSSYTDPNGTVFTCKPEAVIKLSTSDDTLYVKDFKTLTTVKESPKKTSKTTEGEKLTNKTIQTFSVGGKDVVFDLAYDVYNHVNSKKESIEMPYMKLNAARYGAAKAEEAETRSASVAVTGIRLTPHAPLTRGTIVDSTTYDVNVAFNLDIESMNAKEAKKQTLSFEVEFLAVVESTTDYPDPEMLFSYQLQVSGGTSSTKSPFVLSLTEPLSICYQGTARYNYFDVAERASKTILLEPKANVTITAGSPNDTIWASTKEELRQYVATEAVITEEGTSPLVTTGQKTFTVAGRDITFGWSYDVYEAVNVEGTDVAMPYMELSEPQVISVSAIELPDVTVPGKQAKVYEVKVRLSQELKSKNAPQEQSETIEYIVRYIGALDIKLVKVVYRKDWEWIEPHDNIPLAYYPIVYRDRIYSTGETFTDTFRDAGHVAGILVSTQPSAVLAGEDIEETGIKFFYNHGTHTNIADSIITISGSVAVPDLSLVQKWINPETGEDFKEHFVTPQAGTWEKYKTSKLYTNLDIPLNDVEIIGAGSTSTSPSGWYFLDITYRHNVYYFYNEHLVIQIILIPRVYDQFLVIDGQMINFLEFREPAQFNFKEQRITMSNGAPGKVVTADAHLHFLGRNFYGAATDTIYQQTPTAPSYSNPLPKREPKPQTAKLPPPYKDLPSFEYGGDPFNTKH